MLSLYGCYFAFGAFRGLFARGGTRSLFGGWFYLEYYLAHSFVANIEVELLAYGVDRDIGLFV